MDQEAAEWKTKMKKGDVIVTIQNSTNFRLQLTNSILKDGKFVKKSEVIDTVLPMSTEEMGIAAKSQGEFVWTLQPAEPGLNQLRLLLNSKDNTARVDDVPDSAAWQVDVQQQWAKSPAQVLLTVMNRADPADSASALTQSGKKRTSSPTKKKSVAAVPETVDISDTAKALSGLQSDSDSDSDDWDKPQRKISIVIKNNANSGTDGADDLRSVASRLSLGGPNLGNSRSSLTSSTDSPKPSRRADSRTLGSSPSRTESDFATEMSRARNVPAPIAEDSSEDEELQMALALSRSEAETASPSKPKASKGSKSHKKTKSSKKNQIQQAPTQAPSQPQAQMPGDVSEAVADFTAALTELDNGALEHASQLLNQAIQLLPQDAQMANQILPIIREWAAYRILIAILLEMRRLAQERLWAQRALVSKFAALIATSGAITLPNHQLIALRMVINRNLEVGNFYTAAEFIRVMQAHPALTPEDAEALKIKLDVCRQHGTETVIPVGATYDANTGVLLDGRRLVLCLQTMRLIRGTEYTQCRRCGSTYSAEACSSDSPCLYCMGPLIKRQM